MLETAARPPSPPVDRSQLVWLRGAEGAVASVAAEPAARVSRLVADVLESGWGGDAEDALPLPGVADEDLPGVARALERVGATRGLVRICQIFQTMAEQPWASEFWSICDGFSLLAALVGHVAEDGGSDSVDDLAHVMAEINMRSPPRIRVWSPPREVEESRATVADRAARLAEAFAYLGVPGGDIMVLSAAFGVTRPSGLLPGLHALRAAHRLVNADTESAFLAVTPEVRPMRRGTEVLRKLLEETSAEPPGQSPGSSEGRRPPARKLCIRGESMRDILDEASHGGDDPVHLRIDLKDVFAFDEVTWHAGDVPPNAASFTVVIGHESDGPVPEQVFARNLIDTAAALPPGCVLRVAWLPGLVDKIAWVFTERGTWFKWKDGPPRRIEIFQSYAPPVGRRALPEWIRSGKMLPPGGELAVFLIPSEDGRRSCFWSPGDFHPIPEDVVDALGDPDAGAVVFRPLCCYPATTPIEDVRADSDISRKMCRRSDRFASLFGDTVYAGRAARSADKISWSGNPRIAPAIAVGTSPVPAVVEFDTIA